MDGVRSQTYQKSSMTQQWPDSSLIEVFSLSVEKLMLESQILSEFWNVKLGKSDRIFLKDFPELKPYFSTIIFMFLEAARRRKFSDIRQKTKIIQNGKPTVNLTQNVKTSVSFFL